MLCSPLLSTFLLCSSKKACIFSSSLSLKLLNSPSMASLSTTNIKSFLNTTFLLLLCFFFTSHIRSPSPPFFNLLNSQPPTLPSSISSSSTSPPSTCIAFQKLKDHNSKCHFLKTHPPCVSQGYLNYLHLFYCLCGSSPFLGYCLLFLSLLILFYLLGNTASHYFCSSVERLSRELRLSPTIAGVTLLSLGNGSPDVFASIVSFRSGSGEVGLSSVLGGAFFVSCVVVGIINVVAGAKGRRSPRIDRASFVRDVFFFLVVLSSLLAILVVGKVDIWAAMAFTSLYFVYVSVVSATHLCREKFEDEVDVKPLIEEEREDNAAEEETADVYSSVDRDQTVEEAGGLKVSYYLSWLLYIIEMPLYLPRRLTIPDVSDERWSRPYAVASAALAPLLIASLWNSKRSISMSSKDSLTLYLYAALAGLVLSSLAVHTTEKPTPPKSSLFPWLAASFLMSVLWTYIIAEELVGLLVSIGYILGISPGILGLTVLAWGNSIGDLIANLAMATNGGPDGAQIAISGCIAGPIFNTLAGLGLSLVVSAWAARPEPFEIPAGPAVFEILGFMICGLVWALVILPRNDMRLDRFVGIGLLGIYLCFLSLRLTQSLGLV
ncbi:cation/calcium exchanger 1-like [Phalaenopsis equestris]|uniref:cation/calcium exchanger 1-like n=1 Tax=Phalaenopsis equestris TaxID=78828 RepID=UPI0009E3B857|nr:cation/calcium exchanger 1-like [Phalaenopsis equestris]